MVGGGIGGLATAARIKSSLVDNDDVEVVILEKNGRDHFGAGGRCGSFDVSVHGYGTFRHERGPSLLLLRDEYEKLFDDCGMRSSSSSSHSSSANAYGLDMRRCVPAYRVIFDDGDVVSLGYPKRSSPSSDAVEEGMEASEMDSMNKLNSFESHGYEKWMDYLDTCASYLDCGLPNFIEGKMDPRTLPNFMRESFRDGMARWPLSPHSKMLDAIFDSPKLKALASFQDLYVGLEPYTNDDNQMWGGTIRKTAPAVFGLLSALELHPTYRKSGVHAPVGGFRSVASSMSKLCDDLDVVVRYGAIATRVTDDGVHYLFDMDGDASGDDSSSSSSYAESGSGGKRITATSTRRGEGFLDADLVICNADLPYATETILRKDGEGRTSRRETTGRVDSSYYRETYDWNDDLDYSTGVIAFHWSVSRNLTSLNTHNVFMSANTTSDARESWSVMRDHDDDDRDGADTTTTSRASTSMVGRPFNFYVHRPSATDDTACPPGCDSIMVLVPCPTLRRDSRLASLPRNEAIDAYKLQFDDDVVDDVKDAVLRRMSVLEGLEDLEDYILDEVVDTPGTYADYYNVGAGVPFGLVRHFQRTYCFCRMDATFFQSMSAHSSDSFFSRNLAQNRSQSLTSHFEQSHGLGQLSLTRPGSECKTHGNVLFVGASSRPGNGVPVRFPDMDGSSVRPPRS